MKAPDEELARFLRGIRQQREPNARDSARVREALARRLPGSFASRAASGDSRHGTKRAVRAAGLLGVFVPFAAAAKLGTAQLAVGALLLAGAGAGSALLVAGDRAATEKEQKAVATAAPRRAPVSSPTPELASAPQPALPGSASHVGLEPAPPSASASALAAQGFTFSLADEVRLLREAESARKLGDASTSLRLLAEMAKRFPDSPLTEERLALTVLSRCDLGDTSAAGAAFERLRQSFPNSVHTQRLAGSCVASTASFEDL